ncbi:MAG: OmpH family outer membrane protein [Planctomycetota bacterium]
MRIAILAALLLAPPALAGQGERADLAAELAAVKQQLAELRGQRAGLKIGFVDIVRVFDELDEKLEMNAELRQREERRDAELRDLAKRIKDLTEALKLLREDSAEYQKNARELEEAKSEFRARREATEDQLYSKLFDFTLDVYRKIRAEVEDYAREGGYDLVLRVRDPDISSFEGRLRARHKYLELNRRIEYRDVLFHKSSHDFTNVIIKRLNARYARERDERKKAQPAPGEPESREGTP